MLHDLAEVQTKRIERGIFPGGGGTPIYNLYRYVPL